MAVRKSSLTPNTNPLALTIGRGLLTLAIGLGALTGVVSLQAQRMTKGNSTGLTPQQQEQQEILQAKAIRRLPSQGFGFNNLLSDWTFLRFLQYAGDTEARRITGYGAAPDVFETVTARDPRFIDTYVFAAGTLGYELGMPEKSIELLNRGIQALDPQRNPGAHRLLILRGMDELLLMGQPINAAYSYKQAAEWAAQSPNPEDQKEVKILTRIHRFLETDPDSTIVKFWSWSSVFAQAQALGNVKTQERARAALLDMGAIEDKDKQGLTLFSLPATPAPPTTPKPVSGGNPTVNPTGSPNPSTSPSTRPSTSASPLPNPATAPPTNDAATPPTTKPSPKD
jgi:hypothetical protein